jgi:hypothetical protein
MTGGLQRVRGFHCVAQERITAVWEKVIGQHRRGGVLGPAQTKAWGDWYLERASSLP